jgi:hypothetical protein
VSEFDSYPLAYVQVDGFDESFVLCPFTGSVSWCQLAAGSGGSQGLPAMALLMASSAVMPWAAAESRWLRIRHHRARVARVCQ